MIMYRLAQLKIMFSGPRSGEPLRIQTRYFVYRMSTLACTLLKGDYDLELFCKYTQHHCTVYIIPKVIKASRMHIYVLIDRSIK